MIWVWTAVVVVTLILEFITSELVSIWFSTAGIVALIMAICNVDILYQVIAFVVLSIILLFLLRKVCSKLVKSANQPISPETLIGKSFPLLCDFKADNTSEIKVNGVIWTVMTKENFNAKEGEVVEVVEINGDKLIVKIQKK